MGGLFLVEVRKNPVCWNYSSDVRPACALYASSWRVDTVWKLVFMTSDIRALREK